MVKLMWWEQMSSQLSNSRDSMGNISHLNTQTNTFKFETENEFVPKWVMGRKINFDSYYTDMSIAKYCYDVFLKFLKKRNVDIRKYVFVEPSAGMGSFYRLLPTKRRIGIDIQKHDSEYVRDNYLSWIPKNTNKKYIAIGNPPFGYRGWLALSFLNRASKYCDYVGFILPKGFTSESKGSPKYRVPWMKLAHNEELPSKIFHKPDGSIFGNTHIGII